jgi:long-subunit acyl-CoA synthetase (AMP-forming)
MSAVASCQGYGLSEFPTMATVLMPSEVADHEGGAGRPMAFTSVVVRDDQDIVRRSGRGELLIRSMSSMRGYFNNREETEKTFRDGWMHTGDLVELDDDVTSPSSAGPRTSSSRAASTFISRRLRTSCTGCRVWSRRR